jgi:predicted metal-dependent enzyme (double-stranded beta helix superfamily)
MFDLDWFIADCRAAIDRDPTSKSVREVVAHAVSDPSAVLTTLGRPERAGVHELYHSNDLNILNFVWGPRMTLFPHNHLMWVVIGIYTGREDNIFWRRVPGAAGGKIDTVGAKSLGAGEAMALEPDAIHSVTNPVPRLTGAIHVYGGDFFGVSRSEWDPETLLERSFDLEKDLFLFEEANAALAKS